MTTLLLLLLLAGPQQHVPPSFTDEDVRQAVGCAESSERCAPPADRAATIACLKSPQSAGAEAVDQCFAAVMDDCVMRWSATDSTMNTRVILICDARMRAAAREAVDDWFGRAEGVVPMAAMTQYRGLRETVSSRADSSAARQNGDVLAEAGSRTGVWTSFLLFLWREQGRYAGMDAR